MKKYQLPQEFATQWVQALRSGKYPQGRNRLYSISDEGYCCLGVACAMQGKTPDELRGWQWIPHNAATSFVEGIPDLLKGSDYSESFVAHVSEMNDTGKTFKEIADWIEANVEFV